MYSFVDQFDQDSEMFNVWFLKLKVEVVNDLSILI